ncbi:MAG TPA: hypothetical protein VK066_22005 [Chloroflexota bacterium]|nr:hypothetical protein [Chloroflexota bacterium]
MIGEAPRRGVLDAGPLIAWLDRLDAGHAIAVAGFREAVTGLSLSVPVWTLNYRDLAAYPNLHLWTPSAS